MICKSLSLATVLLLTPASARAAQALLWVPAGGGEEVIAALEEAKDARLTAAFSALPAGLEERIKKLETEGRLELALRPAGDPPLPLLYYPAAEEVKWEGKHSTAGLRTDQYFLSLRLSLAREAAVKALGKPPQGLVSPPGGLTADYFPLARALGIKWIACGPLASTAAATMESSGVYAVPFINFSTSAAGTAFTVFDEASSQDPAWLRAMLVAELKASVPDKRLTVSEALAAAVSTSAAPADISGAASPWSGDYSRWASAPLQTGALAALAQTREALMLHLNAAQGDSRRTAPAFNEYFSAEQSAGLLDLASADAETSASAEAELIRALAYAHRLMQKSPPPWALSGLADAETALAQADKMAIETLPDGFLITNAARPPSAPASTPGLPASADPAKIWKLEALKVTTGAKGTLFQFKPEAMDNSLKQPAGFSHIRLDLYMDINRRQRAGITRTLPGRPLRLYPENAWEYALEVTPAGATLYKITPRGQAQAGNFEAAVRDGWINVLLPDSALRGSPGLWSYAALMLAPGAGDYAVTDYLADDLANGYIYAVYPGEK